MKYAYTFDNCLNKYHTTFVRSASPDMLYVTRLNSGYNRTSSRVPSWTLNPLKTKRRLL